MWNGVKLDKVVEDELRALGDRATMKKGTRHIKIYVDGILAATVPSKPVQRDGHSSLNVRANIRNVACGKKGPYGQR